MGLTAPKYICDNRVPGDGERKKVHINQPASAQCDEVNGIPPENRIYFDDLILAHSDGFHDCDACPLGGR